MIKLKKICYNITKIGVMNLLIKNCIYIIAILLSLFSMIALIYSIKNKNKYICKNIILVSILYIVYLIVDLCMIGVLCIPIGLEVLFIYLFVFIAGILYIISIILNLIKRKKLEGYIKKKSVVIATLTLLLLPILFLTINILEDKSLINNSNLIVVYESDGNGGIGDGDIFAYAIGKNFCEQFDLGIDIGGYYLKEFLPKNAVEIKDIKDITNITNYKIVFNEENNALIYKDNKQICKINNKSHYFNIDFERGFYIKN